jgi:hypothetical protein
MAGKPPDTVENALALLRSLAGPISEQLGATASPMFIKFSRLDVMKPPRGTTGSGEAHVLWTGPEEVSEGDEGNRILHNICSKLNLMHFGMFN